jgi:hypothetical protein
MSGPTHAPSLPAPIEAIRRLLATALPEARPAESEPPLELTTSEAQPARLISAAILEGSRLRAHRILDPPFVGIAAFLDGTQESRVISYLHGGLPIVLGTVAGVIRERRNARLYTWKHDSRRCLYLSRAHVADDAWQRLSASGLPLADTSAGATPRSEHPLAFREAAIHRVQKDREGVEQALALEWVRHKDTPLLIDGGISGSEPVAKAATAIGVIKSHRTMYATGHELATVLALGCAERSSVFLVTSPKRAAVRSWYLRLREQSGGDPMWGLVRVEVSAGAITDVAELTRLANDVSRWILAEVSPVALPDRRWDKMVYGIRDCEEFLRACM